MVKKGNCGNLIDPGHNTPYTFLPRIFPFPVHDLSCNINRLSYFAQIGCHGPAASCTTGRLHCQFRFSHASRCSFAVSIFIPAAILYISPLPSFALFAVSFGLGCILFLLLFLFFNGTPVISIAAVAVRQIKGFIRLCSLCLSVPMQNTVFPFVAHNLFF